MENIPVFGRSVAQSGPNADAVIHSISYEEIFLPQGSPFEDQAQERMNSWKPEIPSNVDNPQVYHPTGLCPSIRPAPILDIEMPSPCNFMNSIHEAGCLVLRPSSCMGQTTSPLCTLLNFERPEDLGPAAAIQSLDSIGNWCQERASRIVPQVQSYQYTRDKTLNNSVTSVLPLVRCTTHAQCQESAPLAHDRPQQLQAVEKGPIATSSRSSRQRAAVHGAPRRRYFCKICGRAYAQPQGVTRHQREMHNLKVKLCRHCGVFKWVRPYLLKEHLERQHRDIDPDAELEEIKRNSCRTTMTTTNLLQERIAPPTLEHDRRGHAESQPHPLTISPRALTKCPPISSSAFQYRGDPQPEFAETTVMKSKRDDVRQSDAFNSTCARTPLFPEQRFQITNSKDLEVHSLRYQKIQCGRTATEPPSNPVTALARISTPPVSGYHGNPSYVAIGVNPSGPTYISHTLLPGDDEIQTNGLIKSPCSGGPCTNTDFYESVPSCGY